MAVAFAKEIQDTSEIIVRIKGDREWDIDPVEFTVTLE